MVEDSDGRDLDITCGIWPGTRTATGPAWVRARRSWPRAQRRRRAPRVEGVTNITATVRRNAARVRDLPVRFRILTIVISPAPGGGLLDAPPAAG